MVVPIKFMEDLHGCTQTKIELVLPAISKLSTLFEKFCKHPKANCLRNSKMKSKFHYTKGSRAFDQNMQNIVLICNSKTVWPTKTVVPFLSFSDILLHDAYNFSKKY